jgi:hypothetical protein
LSLPASASTFTASVSSMDRALSPWDRALRRDEPLATWDTTKLVMFEAGFS